MEKEELKKLIKKIRHRLFINRILITGLKIKT